MRIDEIEVKTTKEFIAVYPGRFHPFHRGHKAVYDSLVDKFGSDKVYIVTSDKVDPPRSPFSFEEKKVMMMLAGVPSGVIVQVRSPYAPKEITDQFDPDATVLVYGVGEKDMEGDPRFTFKPKKDGSPSYMQPFPENIEDADTLMNHGYVLPIPTVTFNVLGKPAKSATEMRAQFARLNNSEAEQQFIKDLFGNYGEDVHRILKEKL